jgi:hypothetical protein
LLFLRIADSDEFETLKLTVLPFFLPAKERVVERSYDRMSQPAGHYRQCIAASLLTPDSLRSPALSSASGIEG